MGADHSFFPSLLSGGVQKVTNPVSKLVTSKDRASHASAHWGFEKNRVHNEGIDDLQRLLEDFDAEELEAECIASCSEFEEIW